MKRLDTLRFGGAVEPGARVLAAQLIDANGTTVLQVMGQLVRDAGGALSGSVTLGDTAATALRLEVLVTDEVNMSAAATSRSLPLTLDQAALAATGADLAGNAASSATTHATVRDQADLGVAFGGVAPAVARSGDIVTIAFAGNRPLTSCAAAVAGLMAACSAPSGTHCACAFTVTSAVAEGPAMVVTNGRDGRGSPRR